jgi:hypothetical protein
VRKGSLTMTEPNLADPQHWAQRAADARREAEATPDAEQKKTLLEIAALYDQLAERLGAVDP